MSRPGDIAGDQLRAVVERIETIDEEIKELTEAKKEIYLEAKGNGFDVKILREVIRVRSRTSRSATSWRRSWRSICRPSRVPRLWPRLRQRPRQRLQQRLLDRGGGGRRLSISEAGVPLDRHESRDAPRFQSEAEAAN